MVVDPFHPIAVVEKNRLSPGSVGQHAMKSSVQNCRERRILFIKVDKIGWPQAPKLMPSLLEPADSPRLGKLLPGKDENYIAPLVAQRHTIGEGTFSNAPPQIHSQRFINP